METIANNKSYFAPNCCFCNLYNYCTYDNKPCAYFSERNCPFVVEFEDKEK